MNHGGTHALVGDEQIATSLRRAEEEAEETSQQQGRRGEVGVLGGDQEEQVATPVILFFAPVFMVGLQVLLGLGLSAATWIIVTYPTEKTKERLSSDNVQPEMHLVLGTLLPELAVNMEKGLLWTDLLLRRHKFPTYVRYPLLNLIAYITGPLWFALLMLALIFLLLVITVISFGLLTPLSLPTLGLVLGYAFLVPVWVVSVYILSMPPMLTCSLIGCAHELLASYTENQKEARARRMVKQRQITAHRGVVGSSGGSSSATQLSQRNPPTSEKAWLSKQEIIHMYRQRGLLDEVGGQEGGQDGAKEGGSDAALPGGGSLPQ